jgi:putative membrane protein insertion efficiency factor
MSLAARVLLFGVRVYQAFFSALMPSACKFYPSCSRYAAEAVRVHGARRGSWLALRRVSRCHPFTPGGVDLVPEASDYSRDTKGRESSFGQARDNLFCHSERSEESLLDSGIGKERKIPRFARNDKKSGNLFRTCYRRPRFFFQFFSHRSETPQTEVCATKEARS